MGMVQHISLCCGVGPVVQQVLVVSMNKPFFLQSCRKPLCKIRPNQCCKLNSSSPMGPSGCLRTLPVQCESIASEL